MVECNEGLREQLELEEEINPGVNRPGQERTVSPLAAQIANISGQTSHEYTLDVALLKGGGHWNLGLGYSASCQHASCTWQRALQGGVGQGRMEERPAGVV